jgi:hypothetical protein
MTAAERRTIKWILRANNNLPSKIPSQPRPRSAGPLTCSYGAACHYNAARHQLQALRVRGYYGAWQQRTRNHARIITQTSTLGTCVAAAPGSLDVCNAWVSSYAGDGWVLMPWPAGSGEATQSDRFLFGFLQQRGSHTLSIHYVKLRQGKIPIEKPTIEKQ